MKNIVLPFIVIVLLCMCCNTKKTHLNNRIVSVNNIKEWIATDSTHNKVIIFFDKNCYGCEHRYKDVYCDALNKMDTAEWKAYHIVLSDKKNISTDVDTALLSQFNINPKDLYFWHNKWSYTTYRQVMRAFKYGNKTNGVPTRVPQAFVVDKQGYLAIIKTYDNPDMKHYVYVPRDFSTYLLDEDADYSKEYLGYQIITSSVGD